MSGAAAVSQANASLSRPGFAPSSPAANGHGDASSALTPGRGDDLETEGEDAREDGGRDEVGEAREDPMVAIARDFPGWTVEDHLKVSCRCC